jgi:hypothetical protein
LLSNAAGRSSEAILNGDWFCGFFLCLTDSGSLGCEFGPVLGVPVVVLSLQDGPFGPLVGSFFPFR